MPTKEFALRAAGLAGGCGLLLSVAAPTAAAHVTTEPDEATKGDNATLALRVPNERPDASTVRLTVRLPAEYPLSSVRTQPKPGWDIDVDERELDEPVEVAGAEVTEATRSITWTAQPGTRIAPDQFEDFEVTLGTLPTDTDRLVLPAAQTYDSGEVVTWDAPPAPEGDPEPESPAPVLTLVDDTGDGGHGEHAEHGGHGDGGDHQAHGGEAASADASASAQDGSTDSAARWLGGTGLALGALGFGLGLGALLRARANGGQASREDRSQAGNTSQDDQDSRLGGQG